MRRNSSSQKRRFTRRQVLTLGAGAICTAAATGAYAKFVEPDDFEVTTTDVTLRGWKYSSSILAGHLSDLHCTSESTFDRAEKAVKLLQDQNPEVVFLTGDFLTRRPEKWADRCGDLLARFSRARYGAYAVLGNHDWWSGGSDRMAAALTKAGIKVLQNKSVPLPIPNKGLWVTGLDDVLDRRDDIGKAISGLPERSVRILLVHEPDYADECPPGFALQLSGHSHGGQICLPGGRPIHVPLLGRKYPRGLNQGPSHPIYTTRGIGMVGLKYRLFSPPEITMLRLKPQFPA